MFKWEKLFQNKLQFFLHLQMDIFCHLKVCHNNKKWLVDVLQLNLYTIAVLLQNLPCENTAAIHVPSSARPASYWLNSRVFVIISEFAMAKVAFGYTCEITSFFMFVNCQYKSLISNIIYLGC